MKSNLWKLLCRVLNISIADPISGWVIASIVMSTVSAGLAVMQGHQQQQIAKANAARLNMQAERERQAADRNAKIAAQRRKRERAQATAAYAASGVLVDEGSPLIVEAEDDYRAEVNQQTIIATGYDIAGQTRSAAAIEVARGNAARSQAYGQAVGEGASLLGNVYMAKKG